MVVLRSVAEKRTSRQTISTLFFCNCKTTLLQFVFILFFRTAKYCFLFFKRHSERHHVTFFNYHSVCHPVTFSHVIPSGILPFLSVIPSGARLPFIICHSERSDGIPRKRTSLIIKTFTASARPSRRAIALLRVDRMRLPRQQSRTVTTGRC